MRASYDSLCLKVKSLLEQDPFSGHVFVFINRRRTSVKCLCYDGHRSSFGLQENGARYIQPNQPTLQTRD
jgi:hypothetical protein